MRNYIITMATVRRAQPEGWLGDKKRKGGGEKDGARQTGGGKRDLLKKKESMNEAEEY